MPMSLASSRPERSSKLPESRNPERFLAGNYLPDHNTISSFRKQFLPQLQDLFVQVLLLASEMGLLEMSNLHIDGTKIRAPCIRWHVLRRAHKKLIFHALN